MLIKNIYTRIGANIIQGGLSIITSIFIVRSMGVEVIGKIAYYYSLVGMLTLFTDLGVGMTYQKFLTSDASHKQIVAGFYCLKLCLILIFCLISIIAYHWFYQSLSLDKQLLLIVFIITPISLFSQFFSATLIGKREFYVLSKIEVFGSSLLFIYNIIVCIFFPNIYLLALNVAILPLCTILYGCYYCTGQNMFPSEFPSRQTLLRYFRYAYPIAFTSIVGLFTGHFEKIVLGRLIGMKELGFYRLALGIFSGFDKVIKPVTGTLFTELSYRINKSAGFIQTKFCDLIQLLSFFGAVLGLLLVFTGKPVVELFYGLENIRTAVILQCFSLAILSRLFWRPYRHVLYAIEEHHPLAYLSVIQFAMRICGYYLLIPLTINGLLVGAIAFPLTEFILWILPSGIYNIIALRKRFGNIHIMSTVLKVHLPLGLIVFAAFYLHFSLLFLPLFLILFLVLEYYLDIITLERWNSLLLPIHQFFNYSKV